MDYKHDTSGDPGTWQFTAYGVLLVCRNCGEGYLFDTHKPKHIITSNGQVNPAFSCPAKDCKQREFIALLDYDFFSN